MQAFKKTLILLFGCLVFSSIFAQSPSANEIFKLTISPAHSRLHLDWKIKPGYFLYQERIIITPLQSNITWPKAIKHQDRLGIWHQIYRHQLHVDLPFTQTINIKVQYQGCSDKGICFPPQTTQKTLVYQSLGNFFWTLLSFFGLGMLLAFTPCVLPMLPIMTQVVLGHAHRPRKQIFGLALSYVLGMSFSYALVGAVFSQLGKNLFMMMQNPKIVVGMAIVYTYLGLATLQWVQIRLPQGMQQKTLLFRSHLQSGRYGSAFIMGSLSLLVLSPCVTAPLLGALTYITQWGQIWKGTLALWTLGLGMGLPLMIFAISAGHLIPKAGAWMENIKELLALLLFGVTAVLIQRTFASSWAFLPWIAVFLLAAWFIRPQKFHTWSKPIRMVLMTVLLVESIMLAYGLKDPLARPWPFKKSVTQHHHFHQASKKDKDIATLIKNANQPVILYFTAKWCATCQYLEKNVWPSQQLLPLFNKNQVIEVDITENKAYQQQIMQQFHVIAPPTVIQLQNPHHQKVLRLSGEEITIEHLKKWIAE